MILEKLTVLGLFKAAAILTAGLGAFAVILSALGFKIATPTAELDEFKEVHAIEHTEIDSALLNIDRNMSQQMNLTEGLVRGECLENAYSKLARQGVLVTCKSLGIERNSNDAIDRELARR